MGTIQGGNPPSSATASTVGPAVGNTVYIPVALQGGVTLESLAKKWGVSIDQIKRDNPNATFDAHTVIQVPLTIRTPTTWHQLSLEAGESVQHLQQYQQTVAANANSSTSSSGAMTPTEASELNTLQGTNRDAYAALMNLFNSYGLSSLAPTIFNYVQQGYSSDTISILLQSTPEYEQRFAGNAIRQKNGLSVLSPADYLATEASYYQVVQAAGLPSSFYDSPSDWTQWIGNDVSASEVQSRVNMAQQATQSAPPDLVQALNVMGVPTSSLVAYFLDDSKALPILQKQFNAAQIGAAALRNGLAMDANRATTFANMGISVDTANQAYEQIGMTLPTLEMLGKVYNQTYSQSTAEDNLLMGNAQAALQTQKLESQEKSAFSGNSGVGQNSLTTNTPSTGAGKY